MGGAAKPSAQVQPPGWGAAWFRMRTSKETGALESEAISWVRLPWGLPGTANHTQPEERLSQKVLDLSQSATGGPLGSSLQNEVNKTACSCLSSPQTPEWSPSQQHTLSTYCVPGTVPAWAE